MDQASLQGCPFVVDETPHCAWDWDPIKRNRDFLNGVDPRHYEFLTQMYETALQARKPSTRRLRFVLRTPKPSRPSSPFWARPFRRLTALQLG